jgi:hypothetical protein
MKKKEFLSVASQLYEALDKLKELPTFYDYEKSFVALRQQFGKACMEKQLNEASVTKEKMGVKNSHPIWRARHSKVQPLHGRFPSRVWRQPVHAGVDDVRRSFGALRPEPRNTITVSLHSEALKAEDEVVDRTLPPVSREDVLYAEIDGSMVCTRHKESWKEVKLARLFRGSDCLNPNSDSS